MIKLVILLLPVVLGLVWFTLLGRMSSAGLRHRSRPLRNDRLERLVMRLADTAGVDAVRVRVLDEPTINGLATPTGDVYVTRGLVDQVQKGRVSPEEFASVVAHELGHLALGHTKRRALDVALGQGLATIGGAVLARLVPVIGWYIARMLSQLAITSLSRKDEFDADAYATALMIRSGIGAEPQARMLEKLEALSPGLVKVTGPAAWLASHPPVRARADAIRTNAARWQADPAG